MDDAGAVAVGDRGLQGARPNFLLVLYDDTGLVLYDDTGLPEVRK